MPQRSAASRECLLASRSPRFELVPQAADGGDPLRVGGVVLDPRTQAFDVHVEGLGVAYIVRSPDPVDEGLPR